MPSGSMRRVITFVSLSVLVHLSFLCRWNKEQRPGRQSHWRNQGVARQVSTPKQKRLIPEFTEPNGSVPQMSILVLKWTLRVHYSPEVTRSPLFETNLQTGILELSRNLLINLSAGSSELIGVMHKEHEDLITFKLKDLLIKRHLLSETEQIYINLVILQGLA